MRCKAKDVRNVSLIASAYHEYGMLMLEGFDCAFGAALVSQSGFGRKRLERFFDGQREYLEALFRKYSYDRGLVYDERRKVMREEDEFERAEEALDMVREHMRRSLAGLGFRDPLCHEIERTGGDGWVPQHQREKRLAREQWYTLYGKDAGQLYTMGTLLHLNETDGFGAQRLGRLYDAVKSEISRIYGMFFEGTPRQDDNLHKRIDELHGILVDHGVSLVEIELEPKLVSRIQPVRAETDSYERIEQATSAVPEKYRQILDEVRSGRLRV